MIRSLIQLNDSNILAFGGDDELLQVVDYTQNNNTFKNIFNEHEYSIRSIAYF